MTSRLKHIKRVNEVRSKVTKSVLDVLDDLENGTGGDYGGNHPNNPADGFTYFGISNYRQLKGQLNSYRAQKIAQCLGKTISKQHLLKYAKPKGYVYSLSNTEIEVWLQANERSLRRYWKFHKGVLTGGKG